MGIIYAEWKATCDMAFNVLCRLLKWANTLRELIQYMSNLDIDSTVRKNFSAIHVWRVDAHILAFLAV